VDRHTRHRGRGTSVYCFPQSRCMTCKGQLIVKYQCDSPSTALLVCRVELDESARGNSQDVFGCIFSIDDLTVGGLDKSIHKVQILLADDEQTSCTLVVSPHQADRDLRQASTPTIRMIFYPVSSMTHNRSSSRVLPRPHHQPPAS
jgi:hypothetical protein